MTDRNKTKKVKLSEFIRYQNGEMSGADRNSFEKELQKDPFSEEAAEGFASVSPENISEDISILQKRLKARTAGKRRFIYYSIAASVAVLMVISTVLIFIDKNHAHTKVAATYIPEKTVISDDAKAPATIEGNIHADNNQASDKNKKVKSENIQIARTEDISSEGASKKVKDTALPVFDSVSVKKSDYINALEAEYQVAAPKASKARITTTETFKTSGKVLSSEDNMPVPGVNISLKGTNKSVTTDTGGNFTVYLPDSSKHILVASYIGMESKEFTAKGDSKTELKLNPDMASLNEVIVVGYGARKAEEIEAEGPSGYSSPQPIIGKAAFSKYIEANIVRPDSLPEGQRVVVVLSFMVRADGKPDSIMIVRSPGKKFSDEAIRLIKSGPQWKPAQRNGKPVEDEVRIKIAFK
jgi:TonB family protein